MEQKIKTIMVSILGIQEDTISDETSLENTERWDSLKHIELILAIEEEFEVPEFSMDEIVEMTSFAKMKKILRDRRVEI